MTRKTVDIKTLVDYSNGFLSAPGGTPDSRYGVISVLETILLKARVYKGFFYLSQDEVGKDDKPGIRYLTDENGLTGDSDFTDTDSTRRWYIL